MRMKTSLQGFTHALTTLLLLNLYPGVTLIAEKRDVASQSAIATIGKSIYRRNESTSHSDVLSSDSAKAHSETSRAGSQQCPPPTKPGEGGRCVITDDTILSQTLIIPSNISLDCLGHRLIPKRDIESPPQVGIFLNEVRNVRIERCVIDDFDFGIFAIKSKRNEQSLKSRIVIAGNTIRSHYTGVSLISVDDAELTRNHISFTNRAGRALYIGRNSDGNNVSKNTFVAEFVSTKSKAFRVPGPASTANPEVTAAGGVVVIAQIEGPEPTLLNAIIDNKLFQLTTTDSLVPNSDFSEGNRFEQNEIRFLTIPVDGVVLTVPEGTQVLNNVIATGAEAAIRVGMQNNVTKKFPGNCSLDITRLCFDDAGCNIRRVDAFSKSKGRCVGVRTRIVNWIARHTRIEGNGIIGEFGSGITTSGQGTTIIGNEIHGHLRDPQNGAGIRLVGKHGIETSTVMGNSVSDAEVALSLVGTFQGLQALTFGAQVSLNDFTGYKTAVQITKAAQTDPNYNLESELSVAGQGNFWGTLCGVGLDPNTVKNSDGTTNFLITDSHPYNESVAKLPIGRLPLPCPVPLKRR